LMSCRTDVTSSSKEYSMELQSITINGNAGPHLLITGGVHGDEFEPMVAIRRLSQHVTADQLRGRLTLIPVVNEPAFARCHRTAEDEKDLARTCPGRADGTITERIAHALSQHIHAADYYIDLHTGGTRLAVLPLTGYCLHPDATILDKQRQMAREFNLPVIWGTDPHLQGRSLSVARDANVPAIYAEYLGSATCDPHGIEAYVEGCLNVMRSLNMIDRDTPDSRIEYVVEDGRPSSGHMQICNPSPADGYFESAVRLGDRVHVGDVIGTVSDPLGRIVHKIESSQSGIVLVLHTYCRVEKGTSLIVVLETT